MNGHIVITARDGGMPQTTPELLAKLRKRARASRPCDLTLERQALISAGGQTRGALMRGVRLEDLLSRDIVTKNIVHGELGDFGTAPGRRASASACARRLGIAAGDKITITTHRLNEYGTIAPRYSDYDVLAASSRKRYEFDNALVFVPLQMLQERPRIRQRTVSSIDLDLADPNAAPQVADGDPQVAGPRRPQGLATGRRSTPASSAPCRSSG